MRIRWTVPAADDLEGIRNYLQQHYTHLMQPTMRTIYSRIRSLKASPDLGDTVTEAAQESLCLRLFRTLLSMW